MVKRRIAAAGLLPNDIEKYNRGRPRRRGDHGRSGGYSVSIVEYRSRPISAVGAVRHPLTFQAAGELTLLDAISRAEGLTEEADPEVLVTISSPVLDGRPNTLVRRPVFRLINAADPEVNLAPGGEEVRPRRRPLLRGGNVKKPGTFSIRRRRIERSQLALSEGFAFAGNVAYLYRQEGAADKNEIPIELKKIGRTAPRLTWRCSPMTSCTSRTTRPGARKRARKDAADRRQPGRRF